jgi:hypothetical protein
MMDLGPTTEDQMILAFIQAEIDSPRFGKTYADILQNSKLSRTLIDNPNIGSSSESQIRRELLRLVRGYGSDSYLFRGFPMDTTWRRFALEAGDYRLLLYANHPTWTGLSAGTRLVIDGARNIDIIVAPENASANIKAVAARLREGKRYPELIAVEGEEGILILVEGHTRATAYVVAQFEPIEIIVGTSRNMSGWAYY